jgi:hypothetical protein
MNQYNEYLNVSSSGDTSCAKRGSGKGLGGHLNTEQAVGRKMIMALVMA